MSTAKELLQKLKAMFDMPMPPAPSPAPIAPPAGKPYLLQDGTTQISIVQAGDMPAIGDVVTINGAPAPANTYTLQDGSTLTTDATGTITAYVPMAPVTADPLEAGKPVPPAAPAPPARFDATPEKIKEVIDRMTPEAAGTMLAAFANGSDQDRIANLELVCKALMEYNFGWQIRENQQKVTTDAAIEVYKQDLITAQAALAKQDIIIKKQEEKMVAMFGLMEELAKVPTADPITVPPQKVDKFSKTQKSEEQFKKIAASLNNIKNPA